MRLLLCCHLPLTRALGGAKVFVEIADAMRGIGWTVDLVGPETYAPGLDMLRGREALGGLAGSLRAYLRRHSGDYDVVDYSHEYLPFARTDFPSRPLFVARSVLLVQHLDRGLIPRSRSLRNLVGALLHGRSRRRDQHELVDRAQRTVKGADLVNVSNAADREELVRRGVADEKVVVLPYGLSDERMAALAGTRTGSSTTPVVAFVGTFDYRKGALDFAQIVARVRQDVPDVTFRLIGTQGLFSAERDVRRHFPRPLQSHIEVVPSFEPETLPGLLDGCSVGVFPSYLEGFGFGVLEMLAAGLPVVAYDAPGPPEMLPREYLVPPGDARAMGHAVAGLLRDPNRLKAAQAWAGRRAGDFRWVGVASRTADAYQAHQARRAQPILAPLSSNEHIST